MRRGVLIGVMTLAFAATVLAASVWLGCLHLDSRHVAMPPASATPEEVVEAWAAAIDGHDCDTAAALWSGPTTGEAADLCRDMRSFQIVRIIHQGDVGGEHVMGTVVYQHPLPFRWGGTLMLHGWTTPRAFELERQGDGAWRITSYGQGG